MIQQLRNYTQNIIFRIFLFFVAATFVISFGWLASDNQKTVVAKVNSEEILFQDYNSAYERRLEQLRQTFGENAETLASQLNLEQTVLNSLISRKILLQNAKQQGIVISDSEVIDQLKTISFFQEDGRFSAEVYERLLKQNRLTPEAYESSLREDLILQKYQSLTVARRLSTQEEASRIYDYEQKVVSVQYLEFPIAKFLDQVVVDEEELKKFYEQKVADFMSPKKYKIEYLTFGLNDLPEQTEPSDRMIKRYYDKNTDEFATQEQVNARHILMKVPANTSNEERDAKRQKLEEVLQKAKTGESFEELAKQYSEDLSAMNGGDLGWFESDEMEATFVDAAFALKEGEVSEIVETGFGLHIIKLEGKRPAQQQTLEQVKDEIRQRLIETRQETKLGQSIQDIEKQLNDKKTLSEVASSLNLETQETDYFTEGETIQGIGSVDQLMVELDGKLKDETGQLFRNPVQGHLFFKVVDIQEPKPLSLEEVREQVEQEFRQSEAVKLAQSEANSLLNNLKEGTNWEDLQSIGSPQMTEVRLQTPQIPGIGNSQSFQANALALSEANLFASARAADSFYLMRFMSSEIEQEGKSQKLESIHQRLTYTWNNIIFEREIQRLRAKANIEILNPSLTGATQNHSNNM